MKTKILNVFIDVLYIGLLIAGLRDPQSWLMDLPVAFTWLLNTIDWLAAFAGALALVAGGEAKAKMRAQLVLFFNRPDKGGAQSCIRLGDEDANCHQPGLLGMAYHLDQLRADSGFISAVPFNALGA